MITTFAARGLLPLDHPCLAPNPVHTPEVGELWDEADVVLAIGTDFDGLMTQNWLMPQPPTLIAINVDADDAAKNYPPDLTLVGDARAIIERLLPKQRDGLDDITLRLAGIGRRVRQRIRDEEPQAYDFLSTLDEVLPMDAVLVSDMCVAGYWVGGFHRVRAPRKLAYPMGWGTLGYGFPASLGAAAAGSAAPSASPATAVSSTPAVISRRSRRNSCRSRSSWSTTAVTACCVTTKSRKACRVAGSTGTARTSSAWPAPSGCTPTASPGSGARSGGCSASSSSRTSRTCWW